MRDRRTREGVRVTAILSAAEAKIRFVISFILTPSSSEDNLDASDRCVACRVVDITPRGAQGRGDGQRERKRERKTRERV